MRIKVSTPEQIEFAQIFDRLAKDFNVTQGNIAKSLSIERSYVYMLIKGQRRPSKRLLESLRALEVRLRGGDPNAWEDLDNELRPLLDLLKKLKERDRPGFLVAKRVVEALAAEG